MKEKDPNEWSIKQWAEEDRPREKLMLKGRQALSDAELIAILIGSGTRSLSAVEVGKLILKGADNNLNQLAKFTLKQLTEIKGIGEAKAITIMSALELGRRRKAEEVLAKPIIGCSDDVFEIMKPELTDLEHEEFWALMLSRSNQVKKKVGISKGGVSGTVADPKIIFQKALEELASSIILIHNHPSGNLQPSEADIRLTRKMTEAGKLLDLPVLDHLIFTNQGFFSFADEGMM